jgi:hypothetical protein
VPVLFIGYQGVEPVEKLPFSQMIFQEWVKTPRTKKINYILRYSLPD